MQRVGARPEPPTGLVMSAPLPNLYCLSPQRCDQALNIAIEALKFLIDFK